MINIDICVGNQAHAVTITGHAGYSDHGNDIVCAGVSAIAYTLLGFLENHRDDIAYISAQHKSGDIRILCKGGEKVEIAFEMANIGLQQIAKQYPKHVTIDIHLAAGE